MPLLLDGEGSLHRQVYRALRGSILAGELGAGERLPSSRSLAEELQVARNTVLQAFDQLVAEGYVETRGRSGTFVAESRIGDLIPAVRSGRKRSGRTRRRPPLARLASRVERAAPSPRGSWMARLQIDFRYGEPSYGDLPLTTWSRLVGRRVGRISQRRLSYPDLAGEPELREAISNYLRRARGVDSSPGRIFVTAGSQQAIDFVARLLVDPGQRVVIEEPHYFGFTSSLAAIGAQPVPVPVDEHGIRTAELRKVRSARLACVTPSHQFPRGGILPLDRRIELLKWARARNAWILEDDYDSEFRYDGRPIAPLQLLDEDERVLYVGTSSKMLFPGLRLGWMLLPEELIKPFTTVRASTDFGSSTLEQLALADFIDGGHLERYLRRARRNHGARRDAMLQAIESELGSRARVFGAHAGLHVLVALDEIRSSRATSFLAECRRRSVGVYPANRLYMHLPRNLELLLGYGSLTDERIREGIRRIRLSLDASRASGQSAP